MNQLSPLSKSMNGVTHKLEGKPWKQWWQIADIFKLRQTPLDQDRYQNANLRAQLTFLLSLPFFIAFQLHIAPQSSKLALLAGAVGVAMGIFLYLTFKQHCRYALSARRDDNGLFVQSPICKRRIPWHEMRESYINQNGDCELILNDGVEVILSKDLTDSQTLFEEISKRSPNFEDGSSYNYRLHCALIDGASMACFAIIVACLFPVFTWLCYPERNPKSAIEMLKFSAVVVPLALAYWRWNLVKFAEVVRIGDNECSIRTRKQALRFTWSDLKAVKRLGGFILLQTRKGTFMLLANKKEPVSQKLMEGQKRTLIR